MPRYIDAEKVKHDVLTLFSRNKVLIDEWLVYCVDDVIDSQPTADVVEVVRCKECKWWRDTDHTCREWGGASPRLANAFCSEGERREDEESTKRTD